MTSFQLIKRITDTKIKYSHIFLFLFGIGILLPINYEWALIFLLFLICCGDIFSTKYDFFSPYSYFFAWYFYYYGLGYICYRIRNSIGINTEFSDEVVLKGILYSLTVAILLKILIKTFEKKAKVISFVAPNEYFRRNNFPLLLCFGGLLILINAFFFYKLGGVPILISGYHDSGKATLGKGLGYLEYLTNWANVLIYFTLIAYFNKKHKDKLSFLIIIFCLIIMPILSDSRSSAVFAVINLLFLYSWNVKKVSTKKIIIAGLLMAVFATLWGVIRNGKNGAIAIMVFMAEIGVEYDNFLDCINMFPAQFDFRNGQTLISCFTLLMPRAILPNKNDWLTAGEYFKEIKHHDYIRVGERMSLLGEMYMNFSFILGVIISILLLIFILYIAKQCYLRKDKNIYLQYFGFYFTNKSKGLIDGDTSTWFSSGFYDVFFLIFLAVLFYSMKKTQNQIIFAQEGQS